MTVVGRFTKPDRRPNRGPHALAGARAREAARYTQSAGVARGFPCAATGSSSHGGTRPAVALLSCLVTDAGTRNIVSRSDLVDRVTESESVTEEAVSTTLDALVQNTGLVRQEFRDRTAFHQIISEFLVPWIRDQKANRARIEAERTLVHERQEAAQRLAQEREAAEQKLALQSAEADRLRARDLAETLRKVRRSRAVLAVLLVLLLGGWSLAAWQTGQARREKAMAIQERNAADAARETAAQEKESAKSAEDAARTALEKNSKLAVDAEKRLLAAGRVLNQTKQTTQALLEKLVPRRDQLPIAAPGISLCKSSRRPCN